MTTHTVGNYSFQWTDEHMPKKVAEELKHDYDELGHEVIKKLQKIAAEQKQGAGPASKRHVDFYELLRQHHSEDETLSQFWEETHSVPGWVDWEQIERGQKFLYRYALGNLMGFALQGFMAETTAAPGVAEVLIRTGGFSARSFLRRLFETFQFLLQVTESLDAVRPGGIGHTTTIRVRLIHSMVQERIMNIENTRGNYFNLQELGIPISTVGSIHSMTTFCCNHSWLQLPVMGIYPTEQESADYVAVFRYISHVIGTPTEYFASGPKAKATMESMLVNEFRLNDNSLIVAHNFLESLTDWPPFNISTQFIEAGSRVLNGDDFCDRINLGHPGPFSYAAFKGFCWLIQALAFVQRSSSSADEAMVGFFKRLLHNGIIHNKKALAGGTKSSFKYVPQADKLIGKEYLTRVRSSLPFTVRPVESFFFGVFMFSILSPLALTFFAFRYLSVLV